MSDYLLSADHVQTGPGSHFPGPAAADPRIRAQLQALDARSASRTLALAGVLSLNRATLVPWALDHLTAWMPASERAQFAGYLDPGAANAALLLAAVLFLACLLAGRRPLLAVILALITFVALSTPLLIASPVLVGGGHLGRIVMLLILLRALGNGLVYHAR